MNEELKKECMGICEEYDIDINFSNENWENEFIEKISWEYISVRGTLSENFIEYFQDYVDWSDISKYYKISKKFANKFKDKLSWFWVSIRQKLSENFIEYFQNRVDWNEISTHQKLSENFIEKFQDRLDWNSISMNQKLSENFIDKFLDKLNLGYIYEYQKISEDFVKKYKDRFAKYFWNLKTDEEKENDIKNAGYEILEDENGKYILAYKAISEDNKSFADPKNYKYVVGKIYKSDCDCNITENNSHGLAAWNKENVIEFGEKFTFKLIKVKIYISDIGAIIKDNKNKIRCFKFQVVEDLGVYKNGNE